jgi:hypothetical protein
MKYMKKWDSKEQQLVRLRNYKIVLKKLENVESAVEEVCNQKNEK